MEFQIVSHACAKFRAGYKVLVVDPWLTGPIYWGAWWHCPLPVYDDQIFQADYVYITHWHFDHMHAESLSHFSKDTHFLVPHFPVSILAQTLRDLGFSKVTELDNGIPFEISPDFVITSFQISYQDDSCCVIEADGVVVVNLNDAHPLPSTWKRLLKAYPKVDFMFRSHSPAWSYPSCYTFDNPAEAISISRETYMEAWRAAASILKPTYGVPFASSVCHPHPEVLKENEGIVSAFELEQYLKMNPLDDTKLAIMPPGSRWSPEKGFDCAMENAVSSASAFIQEHNSEYTEFLETQAENESVVQMQFEVFERFFRGMLTSLPLLPARIFLNIKLVFSVEGDQEAPYWSVNFRSGKVLREKSEPAGATSVIHVHPAVLDDALRNFLFTNIDISKRWQVHVRSGGVTKHLIACVIILLYEAGYLSPRNFFRWRFVSSMFSRRGEVLDYLNLCIRMLRSDASAVAQSITDPL